MTDFIAPQPPAVPAETKFKRIGGNYPHINATRVKKLALEVAKQTRAKGFNRVSSSFLDFVEATVKNAIISRVKQQPSVGKTLT